MTIKELKEMYKGEYSRIEVYVDEFQHQAGFHTDRIQECESWEDDAEVLEHELMDEEEYNNSILVNCGERFSDFFEPEEKILVVKVDI